MNVCGKMRYGAVFQEFIEDKDLSMSDNKPCYIIKQNKKYDKKKCDDDEYEYVCKGFPGQTMSDRCKCTHVFSAIQTTEV